MSDQTLYPNTDVTHLDAAIGREDQAVIDLATAAAGPQEVEPGKTYAVAVPAGGAVRIVDRNLDQYRARPRRKEGRFTAHDADSFIAYLAKHSLPETEVWADVHQQRVVAVLNGHQDPKALEGVQSGLELSATEADFGAGWGDHRLHLELRKTPAWVAWETLDRKLLTQLQFAEHVEDRLVDVREPAAAVLLEVAQTFTAKRRVSFESSQRLSTGEIQVEYRETDDAQAGKKGQLAFPEQIVLGLVPFEGGPAYKVTARLRYRIEDGQLRIGFVLDRPDDVLRTAFLDDLSRIEEAIEAPVFRGIPATA